jgi:hypothetical protein
MDAERVLPPSCSRCGSTAVGSEGFGTHACVGVVYVTRGWLDILEQSPYFIPYTEKKKKVRRG